MDNPQPSSVNLPFGERRRFRDWMGVGKVIDLGILSKSHAAWCESLAKYNWKATWKKLKPYFEPSVPRPESQSLEVSSSGSSHLCHECMGETRSTFPHRGDQPVNFHCLQCEKTVRAYFLDMCCGACWDQSFPPQGQGWSKFHCDTGDSLVENLLARRCVSDPGGHQQWEKAGGDKVGNRWGQTSPELPSACCASSTCSNR